MGKFPPTMVRLGLGLVLALGFLFMASVFAPMGSHAQVTPTPQSMFEHSTDPHAGLESLGMLEDDVYLVLIYTTPQGPRYTIIERQTGQVLHQLLTASQVATWYPQLPIPQMDARSGLQLMIAPDPDPRLR
jgi:hypothetical protein